MELAALLIAIVAFAAVFFVEWMHRPKLDIVPAAFRPAGPTPWTFAAVHVHNRPMPRPLKWFVSRNMAQACAIDVEFRLWGQSVRAMPTVPARWSSNPQPIRPLPPGTPTSSSLAGPTGPQSPTSAAPAQYEFDATLDSRRHDVPVSDDGEHAAIAILLHSDGAYAFGTDSYASPGFRKPDWKLEHGTYRVTVTVSGSDVRCERSFKLEYLNEDFANFALEPAS